MAKWLEDGRPCSIMFECSECGEKAYFVHGKARGRNKEKRFCGYRYCPWCGAKMTTIEADPTQSNASNTLDALTNACPLCGGTLSEIRTDGTKRWRHCYSCHMEQEVKE